ncbi:nucleotide kinase domain-containing protein [uncultured Eubacterium sp.]|uniref:nucleotide kinase domain-containing protein n=1 Tax=uncultured Eubacterium sp. TaxID=165185 RepID=UPI00345CAAE5
MEFLSLYNIKRTEVFDTYWKFAYERQKVFFKKIQGYDYPWTTDKVLQKYKFTNAYRASDRISQYLIKNIIYSFNNDTEDLLFRILLFKIFNKIST